MATDIVSIKDVIITKLETISGLHKVYRYEIDKPEDGKYPFCTVITDSGEGEFGDTVRNIRKFRFVVNVYQERTEAAFGAEKAERLTDELIDEILTAFDADTRLGGAVQFVDPLDFNTEYVDREIGDTRVAQFIIEATKVVDSVT